MKYLLSLLLFATNFLAVHAQSADETQVRNLLAKQTVAWNEGNIEAFMNGYWNSDSLMFVGKSGITYGYAATLENYKKGYPDTTAMGRLSFEILEVKRLSVLYFFVVGKWSLQGSIGDLKGSFSLLFKKIKGNWVIVTDHSS